jgi:hypothetical protein
MLSLWDNMESRPSVNRAPSRALPLVAVFILSVFWLIHLFLIPFLVAFVWFLAELSGGFLGDVHARDPQMLMLGRLLPYMSGSLIFDRFSYIVGVSGVLVLGIDVWQLVRCLRRGLDDWALMVTESVKSALWTVPVSFLCFTMWYNGENPASVLVTL